MFCNQAENNTGILLYYNFPVIQKPVFEPPKLVIYTTYTYTQNTVIYRATATQEGVYCYTYVVNNPLVYTDPSGELYLWDDLIVAGAGFVFGYVSYGISTGDWGWNAVGSGGIGAGTALLGYYTGGGSLAAGTASAGLNYAGGMALSTVASHIIPPMNIPISNNFSLSVSPGIGFGSNGLVGTLNVTGTYTEGDWSISAGYGTSGSGHSISGGVSYYDRGNNQYFSGYVTSFGGGNDNQLVGGLGFRKDNFSLRIENDFFVGARHDRYRTSAVEMGIGDFVVGTNIYTNDPGKETIKKSNSIWGPNKNETYKTGKVSSSPFYVGYRSKYGVTRMGIDAPIVQDLTQNRLHKWIGSPYFHTPYGEYRRGYSYSGRYNPFTLY